MGREHNVQKKVGHAFHVVPPVGVVHSILGHGVWVKVTCHASVQDQMTTAVIVTKTSPLVGEAIEDTITNDQSADPDHGAKAPEHGVQRTCMPTVENVAVGFMHRSVRQSRMD